MTRIAISPGKKPRKINHIELIGFFGDYVLAQKIADKIESAKVIKLSDGAWEVIRDDRKERDT